MKNENKPKHTPEILKVETISGAAFGFQPDAIDSVVNLKITARAETVESVRTMIAAAPELLEALKKLEARVDWFLSEDFGKALGINYNPLSEEFFELEQARAAIAKAEGK